MSKKNKAKEVKKVAPKKKKPIAKIVEPVVQLVDFSRALSFFRKKNVEKAIAMKDKEAVKAFVNIFMKGELIASQEDWNKIFNKF